MNCIFRYGFGEIHIINQINLAFIFNNIKCVNKQHILESGMMKFTCSPMQSDALTSAGQTGENTNSTVRVFQGDGGRLKAEEAVGMFVEKRRNARGETQTDRKCTSS